MDILNKILTQDFRLRIIRLLSQDLSLLINTDVDGMVIPKKNVFYFDSTIKPTVRAHPTHPIYYGDSGGAGS